MSGEVEGARLAAAAAIVLAIVSIPALAGEMARASSGAIGANGETAGIAASRVVGAGDADEVVKRLETVAETDLRDPPPGFVNEVGLPPACRDVRTDATGEIVSYIVDVDEDEAFEELDARMVAGGWTSVPLGGVCGATYVKEGGECRWVMATCTGVGESTSVVMRCVVS